MNIIGNIKDYFQIIYCRKRRVAPSKMQFLLLWITDNCNLKCLMCGDHWRSEISRERKTLELNDWFSVIDSAKNLGTRVISVTGGEPLLHKHVFQILNRIRDAGIASNMCTNGTLLTEKNVSRLLEAEMDSISISLDSNDPSMHNALRCNSESFDLTVAGIKRLKKMMPSLAININYTISRRNYRNMVPMVKFADDLGVHKVNFAPIHTNMQHRHKPKEHFDGLLFEENDLPALAAELVALRQAAEDYSVRISSDRFIKGIPDFYRAPMKRKSCYAGYASCAVSPWGDVSPCSDFESDINIRNFSLEKAMRSSRYRTLIEKVDSCNKQCWDTTNAEIAIRFNLGCLFNEFPGMFKDFKTYTKGK